ncbi:MAG: cytidine deaminase [Pseudomonadota bacterium]
MSNIIIDPEALIAEAHKAAARAYAPYSRFHVGAALLFDDGSTQGTVIRGANFENASYGLSICAETAALLEANHHGLRTGLVAVAIVGGPPSDEDKATIIANAVPVTPCGRCRQTLNEVAQLGGTDPVIFCAHADGYAQHRLSELLPHAFGPANLD